MEDNNTKNTENNNNENQNEKKEFVDGELLGKIGNFLNNTFHDAEEVLQETKIFKGENFFDLFEKHKPDFNNPLKEENSSFRDTLKKVKESFKKASMSDIKLNPVFQEKEDNYMIGLSVPGFKKEDIELVLEGDVLTISAEVDEESNNSYWQRDVSVSYSFDEDIADFDNLYSKLEDGVLTVTVPKKSEEDRKPEKKSFNID